MKQKSGIVCDLGIRVLEDNEIVSEKIVRAHSFTNNFAYMLARSMDMVGNTSYRNTANAAIPACVSPRCINAPFGTQWIAECPAGMNTIGAIGETARGIVIGTSATAFSVSQYNMQGLIAHGTGSGQMSYGSMLTPADPTFATPNITINISRNISNNSGASIIVREIGLKGYPAYVQASCTFNGTYSVACAEILYLRDVITDTAIGIGQVLNVTYILKTVV